MNPLEERITALESEIQNLKRMLTAAPEYDATIRRSIRTIVFERSDASPADYDQAVNESGSSSYNVLSVPDGFYKTPDGNIIPYFTP